MAKNMVFNSFRMNVNNPQHAKVNAVLSNLDANMCKSKNQMIIDAIEFYIDHFGKEAFIPKPKEKVAKYITVEEFEKLRKELSACIMTDARNEIIRLLAIATVAKAPVVSGQVVTAVKENKNAGDDSVVSDLASSWMEESFDEF